MFLLIRYATDIFERLRSAPRNDWIYLECSIPYITAESRHCIIILLPKKNVSSRISRTLSNQQDSLKSARFLQISKSHANQQDSPESARLLRISPTPEPDGFTPTASHHRAIALYSPPQLLGLSRAAPSIVEGLYRLLRVCGLLILWAPEPLFSDSSFRCPVPFCGLF